MADTEEDLEVELTAAEFAEVKGVSKHIVRRWIAEEKLKCRKVLYNLRSGATGWHHVILIRLTKDERGRLARRRQAQLSRPEPTKKRRLHIPLSLWVRIRGEISNSHIKATFWDFLRLTSSEAELALTYHTEPCAECKRIDLRFPETASAALDDIASRCHLPADAAFTALYWKFIRVLQADDQATHQTDRLAA